MISDQELVTRVTTFDDPVAFRLLVERHQARILISSDLSHYLDYGSAQSRDAATSRAIESLAFEDIGYEDACGRNPVSGLLRYARDHGLSIKTVDLRNSGDTAGPRDRVVGYGTYLLSEPHDIQ